MAFNVRQMPADRAAALIGEDDVAVFSQRLETMAATSQFDLEEPDSTRLTFLFEVGKDDLLREGKWLDGVDYMSDLRDPARPGRQGLQEIRDVRG